LLTLVAHTLFLEVKFQFSV
jgi:hypothetical protein